MDKFYLWQIYQRSRYCEFFFVLVRIQGWILGMIYMKNLSQACTPRYEVKLCQRPTKQKLSTRMNRLAADFRLDWQEILIENLHIIGIRMCNNKGSLIAGTKFAPRCITKVNCWTTSWKLLSHEESAN